MVPPMRTAGGAPRRLARFARQFAVAGSAVYPGNAKNSSERLSSAGSTGAADAGAVGGTATACACARRRLSAAV